MCNKITWTYLSHWDCHFWDWIDEPVYKVEDTASDKRHACVIVSFIRICKDFSGRDKNSVNVLYDVRPRLSTSQARQHAITQHDLTRGNLRCMYAKRGDSSSYSLRMANKREERCAWITKFSIIHTFVRNFLSRRFLSRRFNERSFFLSNH